jgi:hypothetical protein
MSGLPHPNTVALLTQQRQAELHAHAEQARRLRAVLAGVAPRRPDYRPLAITVASALLPAVGAATRQ